MIAAALMPEYGIMAADSAMYRNDVMEFQTQKLMRIGDKYLVTVVGASLYLRRINPHIFMDKIDTVTRYLEEHFLHIQPSVREDLKDSDLKPHFCLYLMGIDHSVPTLIEFNSFQDFKPKIYRATREIKFTTLFYGDDENKEKQEIFKNTTGYMEKSIKEYKRVTPGLVGEILTRGIYHKADLEMKIGEKRKYAGGVVTVGMIDKTGKITGLSNLVS